LNIWEVNVSSLPITQKLGNQLQSDFEFEALSQDKRLNKLLKSVVSEVKQYAEGQIRHIKQLTQIGLALSAEKNISKLLESIVDEARELSNADAGTLYIVDKDNDELRFEILQNVTMNTRMGGTSGNEVNFPSVPLHIDGEPNHSNVSSYVALTGDTINIPDVYVAEGFDFTGPKKYDASTGYRSKSMLVIPMKNHENEIIGVLQLLNAQDLETGDVVAFSAEYVSLIGSLASQAAVALTNTQLIQDLNNLLYAFIKSIATAIDEKSPYTGGHINRVVDLTMMIAEKINEIEEGPYKDIFFSEDEIEELRMAAWMHDVGKITTPEYVVDKATKLHTIFDRIHLIETRFGLIAQWIESGHMKKKIELLQNGQGSEAELKSIDDELSMKLQTLREDFDFIKARNTSGEFMSDENVERIHAIAKKIYVSNGLEHPYLTENEVENLTIRKGTLTDREREVIENHATMSLKMLNQLPFPRKLSKVPEYASAHHEKLDGSGYPRHLTADELPLQSRIMAVADIFDALTAKDRPYKKPMKLSQVIKIMGFMKKDNHIDPDIYDLFLNSGLYIEYAKKEMNPELIDEDAYKIGVEVQQ
jgi:HD-GYP domain-containing protein (c-di-GMP phosphodiesterase class II)